MPTTKRPLCSACLSDRGSVAVEAALLVPLFFFVLWLISASAYTWRLEGAVHRATAALADLLANQRASTSEALEDRLSRVSGDVGDIFLEMVTGETQAESETDANSLRARMQYGLRLTYYNSSTGDSVVSYDLGSLGCESSGTSLDVLGTPGGSDSLVTADNYGALQLVRVDARVTYTGIAVEKVVMPREFSSSFVAVRRE